MLWERCGQWRCGSHTDVGAARSKQSFEQGSQKRPNFESSLDVFESCLKRNRQALEQICLLINCTITDVHVFGKSQPDSNEHNSKVFQNNNPQNLPFNRQLSALCSFKKMWMLTSEKIYLTKTATTEGTSWVVKNIQWRFIARGQVGPLVLVQELHRHMTLQSIECAMLMCSSVCANFTQSLMMELEHT